MAGTLRATVFAGYKGAENIKKAIGDIKGLEDNLGKLGTAGKAISGVMKGVGVAVGAIGAAGFAFGGASVKEAKQLEQNMLGLKTVFGELTPQMEKFTENAYNIGLSQSEAGKASTFLGSVLKQSGFDMDTVSGQTQNLVGLATDLAATYGYDVQDALLGMTALFRGEYDPIEKFGVAMKQNEINAELAARGQNSLTGAALRNAEQQIRLELLLERSTDAQGAMARGAGNLFVEQAKLEAQFKNMQAAVGKELTPALADLAEKLGPVLTQVLPILVDAFKMAGEIIIFLGQTISDLFNPTTELGEKFNNLTNSFNILYESVFGRDFDLQAIFDFATDAVKLFIDVLAGLTRLIFSLVLDFQSLGIMIKAVFTGDWDTVAKGLSGIKNELYDAADAALALANKMDLLYYNAAKSLEDQGDQTEIWGVIGKKAKPAGIESGKGFGEGIGEGAKDSLKDFWSKIYDDIAKQNATNKLEMLGASEGLISAVLGSGEEWQKVFKDIIKGGVESVSAAQGIFNQTANGIKEIEEAAKSATEAVQKLKDLEIDRARQAASSNTQASAYYSSYASMLEAGYEKEIAMEVAREEYAMAMAARNSALIAQQKALSKAFSKAANEIFNSFSSTGATKQIGEYASAVIDLREGLSDLIVENKRVDGKGIFNDSVVKQLTSSLDDAANTMYAVADARDVLAGKISSANSDLEAMGGQKQSLFESIVSSIMGNVDITTLGTSSATIIKSLKNTLEQTKNFGKQITDLRNLGLGSEAINQIISAGAEVGSATAKALIGGGENSIQEVNTLYSQIGEAAAGIGETGASVMYDAGLETMAGLVNGLLAQEQQFTSAAEYLANVFKSSFDSAISGGQTTITAPSFADIMDSTVGGSVNLMTAMGRPQYSQNSGSYNITVNAGMGTDGQSVGQLIVDEIKRFERQSGKVFISA
tara:strand:- start:1805 stop:4606 length:2802 start_codon:yes stop_codon:yes gene_type:complete